MDTRAPRIIFAGTPAFAAEQLAALLEGGIEVCAVYTQPDRPAGRGRRLQASPVKTLALEHQLPVYQPKTLRDLQAQETLRGFQADLMVVSAYGLLLPEAVLQIPTHGCWNIHASLLPRWRGASPIQQAILAGDEQTGVTLMQMDTGLDTGDMLIEGRLPILSTDTGGSLHDKLAALGAQLLLSGLADIPGTCAKARPQPEQGVTHSPKIQKAQAQICWEDSAEVIARQIRAFQPWPVAFCLLQEEPIRLWEAHVLPGSGTPGEILRASSDALVVGTGQGLLAITALQLPGKKALPIQSLLNAHADRFAPGVRLT